MVRTVLGSLKVLTQRMFNQPCAVGMPLGAKNLPKVTQLGNGLYGRGLEPRVVRLRVVGGPLNSGPCPRDNPRIQREVGAFKV